MASINYKGKISCSCGSFLWPSWDSQRNISYPFLFQYAPLIRLVGLMREVGRINLLDWRGLDVSSTYSFEIAWLALGQWVPNFKTAQWRAVVSAMMSPMLQIWLMQGNCPDNSEPTAVKSFNAGHFGGREQLHSSEINGHDNNKVTAWKLFDAGWLLGTH